MHLFFSRLLSGPGAFSEDRHLGAPRATQASVYRYFLAEEGHLSTSTTK